MNKSEIVNKCRECYDLGFWSDIECMYRIIDGFTELNGGRMGENDLADMVDDVENAGWFEMAHFMHGYYWGAAIDDENEMRGEALLNARIEQ